MKIALAALAVTAALSMPVAAATLSIDGGTAGPIPGSVATNEGLAPLGLNNPFQGFYGAQIKLTGPARVTFTYLGSEACNTNSFSSGAGTITTAGGCKNSFSPGGFSSMVETILTAGTNLLTFNFTTNGPLTVNNGSNPDNTLPNPTPGVNFFASIVGLPSGLNGRTGTSLYLFFDDDGANNDDNHDDMVMRIDVAAVPVPAAGLLLVGALGGLAALRRRAAA